MAKKTGPKEPWKLTSEVLQKLEQAFAIDATIREACYYADISESSYYQLVKDDPELSEKFNRLREKPVLKARQTIVNDLDSPDSAKWYLRNKRNQEFNERIQTENELNVTVQINEDTPIEELQKIINGS